jgi:hypothetical protein
MIKSLSPHYINISFVAPLSGQTCTSFTLFIYIWNGLKSDAPALANYTVTKTNPTNSTGFAKINISRLVNDFIDFAPSIAEPFNEPVSGNNQFWVQVKTTYKTNNINDLLTPTNTSTQLFLKGYGYGLEGENPTTPANKILIPIMDYKISKDSKFIVPVIIDEPEEVSVLTITNVTGSEGSYTYTFTSNFSFTQLYYEIFNDETNEWTAPLLFSGITSPRSITSLFLPPFTTRIFAFNSATGNNIYSNEFELLEL